MSLQVPVPFSHSNEVSEWSSFEVYTWIAKHNDKFGLSQDDLDSIEESPLTGKQLMNKDDEQLSQEWAISIHSARKIVKKSKSIQSKAEKRKSEPIISALSNGPISHDSEHKYSKQNDKASSNPTLHNIPEDHRFSDSPKMASINNAQTPLFSPLMGQKYSLSSQYPTMRQFQESLLQSKLTLTIKNDTFMARLSHPKWWMDGHFNHIPNKIGCKDSVNIEITGDIDTPLVGLMSFTLTLDPRYASKQHSQGNAYAFSPFIGNDGSNVTMPHIPSWMIGPGGVPYIPPSVTRLYELQQKYIQKMNETQAEKQRKKEIIERKKKRKQERQRMKAKAKQRRSQIKQEKRKIKREEKRIKKEKEKEAKAKETETDKTDKDKENTDANTDNDDNGSDSVIEKDTESEESSESYESDSESMSIISDADTDEIEIDEPPKYRLIILWSITPRHKSDGKGANIQRQDRRDDISRNSMAMMSVASSDLLNQMNRFNVLLLEDDTDPEAVNDALHLDNAYFNELEKAALIADIEQCLVDNEHFEIAATFGTSPISHTYTLQIDIDDSLGEWPGPLQQFNTNNPFALGFIPTNLPMTMPYNMGQNMQQMPALNYTNSQYANMQSGFPNIQYQNKQGMVTTPAQALNIPKQSGRRSRSNSQPAPPVGSSDDSEQRRLSKMFTLNDVLSASRLRMPNGNKGTVPIAIPESNSTNKLPALISPISISPLANTPQQYGYGHMNSGLQSPGHMQWKRRSLRRKNSHSQKAPRLSLWKEQIDTMHLQHQQQQQQMQSKKLYVPGQERGPHQSPVMSPQTMPVVEQYNIGDCVFVDDSKLGQVKSIGQHPAWGKGTYYGIRLTEKIGNCDGEWKGQRTFSCPPMYGYFVQRNQLTQKIKTTRFDFMNEDYIEDKTKEFRELKAAKEAKSNAKSKKMDQFAAEIFNQQTQETDDEDPGESDIPRPGTNVAQIMGQSSSERILSKTKPTGKYVPKFDKSKKEKEPNMQKAKTSQPSSHRRQRSNSKPANQAPVSKANPSWTGGGPRTNVVRQKIPPIKEHTGFLHAMDGVKYQQQMEWKKAIEKFKLGIALLEVTLMEIDRSMTKRKWKAKIEEFRHKMSRCTFEIQNNKRNRFIKKRDKIAKEQVVKREEAARQLQVQKMQDAKAQVIKREDLWKVTREDMDRKIAENEIDPNYDPSTGIRPDSDDDCNSGRVGGDKTLAKAKKNYKKKKKKGKKGGKDEDWSKYPGFENSGKNKGGGGDSSGSDEEDKKDSKVSKQDKELRNRIEGDVMTADPDVSFADVVGLNNVKLALYETIILPYIRPDLFETVKKSTQGLLLFGPPGNGKTMIAKCVASECDATFFSISASSITSKFVGEAERIMRTLFTMARQRAPSIIFIDEIDSLLRARGGANEAESSRKIKTEFLIQFDGVKSAQDKDKNITVIGATNLPDQLDNAVLRRFPKRIQVPNPDAQARYSLIRLLMTKHRHAMSEKDFRELGDKTENYSCSDIAMLCNDAAMGPLRSMKGAILLTAKKSDIPKIALVHFQSSLLNIRASCDPETIKFYRTWDEQFGSKLFLTMDVLPDNMKQKELLSVEEERRVRNEAEKAKVNEAMAAEAEHKREAMEVQREKERKVREKSEREEQQRLLKNSKSERKDKGRNSNKLLKINAPVQKGSRRKSENLFKKRKKKSDDLRKSGKNQSKTLKIHSSFSPPPNKTKLKTSTSGGDRHNRRSSSHNIDLGNESFADKKKLWNKRSSKSGSDKKKKAKK